MPAENISFPACQNIFNTKKKQECYLSQNIITLIELHADNSSYMDTTQAMFI